MIVFRPFKHPTRSIFLSGRMRKIRTSDKNQARKIQILLKRRDKWWR